MLEQRDILDGRDPTTGTILALEEWMMALTLCTIGRDIAHRDGFLQMIELRAGALEADGYAPLAIQLYRWKSRFEGLIPTLDEELDQP